MQTKQSLLLFFAVASQLSINTSHANTDKLSTRQLAGLTLPFIANTGQTDPAIRFYAQTFSGGVAVTQTGDLLYRFPETNAKAGLTVIERFAQGKIAPKGADAQISQVSYIKNQAGKAVSQQAQTYNKIDLGEVFKGINVTLSAHGNNVEKIYTLAPGANADNIYMTLSGVKQLSLGKQGELIAETANGPIQFTAPVAWQDNNGQKQPVNVSYVVEQDGYRFSLGDYDHNRAVMIDPLLQATYFGGTGTESVLEIQVHPETGDIYLLGKTRSPGPGFSNTLPGTTGSWQPSQKSEVTYFFARMSADLKTLMQATFLEGFDYERFYDVKNPRFFIHPINGDVYIFGSTYSLRNPVPNLAGGAISLPSIVYYPAYLTRVSADLTQVKQSTIVSDKTNFKVVAASVSPLSGDIYLSGFDLTESITITPSGNRDVRVAKVPADLKSLINEIRFGSTKDDLGLGVAVHPVTGDVYVTGETRFNDFPATTGGLQAENKSESGIGMQPDGFIAQLSSDLSTIKQATYLGGLYRDWVEEIVFDNSGNNLFIGGGTCSSDFPKLSDGANSKQQITCSKYFAKLSSDLKTLSQSTMVQYGSTSMSLFKHPVTEEIYAIGEDTFDNKRGYPIAMRFKPDLTYSYGGLALNDLHDHPGVAYAMSPLSGDIYIAGNQTSSTTAFPQTTGGFQATSATTSGGQKDAYIARYTSDDIQRDDPTPIDLKLSIKAPKKSNKKQIVTYRITVKNNLYTTQNKLTHAATDVVMRFKLPTDADFFKETPGCHLEVKQIICKTSTLKKLASKSWSIKVKMPGVAVPNLESSASVKGKGTEKTPEDNEKKHYLTVK